MAQPAFVDHCLELLAQSSARAVRARRMFGGWGLYIDDLFVAIIAFERLYLKADAATRDRFAAAGCAPFVYDAKAKSVTMGYWSAPAEAMDSPALMEPWAGLALQAALSARAEKVKRPTPAATKAAKAATSAASATPPRSPRGRGRG